MDLPTRVSDLDLEDFMRWLTPLGYVIAPPNPKNPWEVLRYRQEQYPSSDYWATSVIYHNKRGRLTFTGDSTKHYQQFMETL